MRRGYHHYPQPEHPLIGSPTATTMAGAPALWVCEFQRAYSPVLVPDRTLDRLKVDDGAQCSSFPNQGDMDCIEWSLFIKLARRRVPVLPTSHHSLGTCW